MDWYDQTINAINPCYRGSDCGRTKRLAKWENERAKQMYFGELSEIALTRYKFNNLPETCDEDVLLWSLLYYGRVCFFEYLGQVMCLPINMGGKGRNINRRPLSGYVFGGNGFNQPVDLWNKGYKELPKLKQGVENVTNPRGIILYERRNRYPFIEFVMQYADKMGDSWRKLDVARRNAATPFIILADQKKVRTIQEAFDQRDENKTVIVLGDDIDPSRIIVENLQTMADGIKSHTDVIEWYRDQFVSLCGHTTNSNQDKKERMTEDEVNAENSPSTSTKNTIIDYMQEQLDFVNETFGTNITVESNIEDYSNSDMTIEYKRDSFGQRGLGVNS